MVIGIICLDSHGGVQPYIALARGLQAAGHPVRLIVPPNSVATVAAWQVASAPLGEDIQALLQRTATGGSERQRLRAGLARIGDILAAAHEACRGVDLIMAGAGGAVIGQAVAEARGVPFIAAYLQPVNAPTTAFPGVFAPHLPRWWGGAGNWLGHVYTDLMISLPMRAALGRARSEVLGLPARPAPPDRRAPVVYGFSPRVIPPPPAWAGRRFVTGYWTLPAPAGWRPPPGLTEFLTSGPPPICFGFGSMPSDDPAALANLLVDAARRAGARALLLAGWGGMSAAAADDVYVAEAVPHSWLLPRVRAVVHHGGAGTTGAGLLAGVPAVVVPHGADQPFWARRLVELGVSPPPIPLARLNEHDLARALTETLTNQAMRDRAAALGANLRTEDGVGAAVALISGYTATHRGLASTAAPEPRSP